MSAILSSTPLIRPAAGLRQTGPLALAHRLLALWARHRHAAAHEAQARQVALEVAHVRRYADAVRASSPSFAADLDAAAEQTLQRALAGLNARSEAR